MEGEKVGLWVERSRDGWLGGGKEDGKAEGTTGWREGGRTDRWVQVKGISYCENE
jgi:hypothetical protein